MKKTLQLFMTLTLLFFMGIAHASLVVKMYLIDGGKGNGEVGTVKIDDTLYGLLLTPKLENLPPGVHGFHIHQLPYCSNHGEAAGGHLDPVHTNQHKGPYEGNGHLGDLPVLIVDKEGKATLPVLAPRLKLADVMGHALMIHADGDNYSDKPKKLGGGGARLACGVIPFH